MGRAGKIVNELLLPNLPVSGVSPRIFERFVPKYGYYRKISFYIFYFAAAGALIYSLTSPVSGDVFIHKQSKGKIIHIREVVSVKE